MPINVYLSYAPEDEKLVAELRNHLLPQRHALTLHYDRFAPDPSRVDQRLFAAPMLLLAVSPDYLASESLWLGEARQALARHREGTARLVIVRLRPALLPEADFAAVPLLPRDGRALSTREDRDTAFAQIAQDLLALAGQPAIREPALALPDGLRLHSLLCQLLPAQFAEVIYRLRVPTYVLPSEFAPQGLRATALLQHVEQPGNIGHAGLWACLQQIAPYMS